MKTEFVKNVLKDIILTKERNVKSYLKIVWKLTLMACVRNVFKDTLLEMENATLKLDQILTVLNKMRMDNVQNVEISMNSKMVNVLQLDKIHSVNKDHANVDQENV